MTKATSAKLLCGALVATVAAVQAPASADPGDIDIIADWLDATGGLYSGFSGVHTFGGVSVHDSYFFGSTFQAVVTSGASQRPGWAYELTVDLDDFALFTSSGHTWDITLVIKDPGTAAPISGYVVKDRNGVELATTDLGSDGGTIHFSVDMALVDLAAGPDGFSVQWNQVPAPGALALLGVAGLVGKRRRRN